MKILRIRFQNLNSLRGIWDIDFSSPLYGENSIFAITGPTGAGKSTLLDALCLALYGATPRLGKITKKSNQIMSRHTGVCFAEVEFSTVKGQFRCHWAQHRSRQKADGELQQPKHEIADGLGAILESRIRSVTDKVVKVTGMDFERFTRSTLLAQGGFAAFLQASADKRSPILEQITGTEIYSQLSIKVHELRLKEQNKLDEIKQTLSHIQLLEPEEEQQLNELITKNNKEIVSVQTRIERFRVHINWIHTVSKLATEQEAYRTQLKQLQTDKAEHLAALKTLAPALAAKELEPIYLKEQQLTDIQQKALIEDKSLLVKQTALEATLKEHLAAKESAAKALQQNETLREAGLQKIRIVVKIDTTLQNVQKVLLEQDNALNTNRNTLKNELESLGVLGKDLERTERELNLLGSFFKQHSEDEKLIEEFGAIKGIVHRLSDFYQTIDATAKKAAKVDDILKQKELITAQLTTKKEDDQQNLTESLNNKKHIQKEIEKVFAGEEISSLQQLVFNAQNDQNSLQELIQLLKQLDDLSRTASNIEEKLNALDRKSSERELRLARESKEQLNKQQQIHLFEKNILLLTRIQTLEEDRDNLHDETPCPLCGSMDHPYNRGNIPELSEEEKLLQQAQNELQTIDTQIKSLTHQKLIAQERKVSYIQQNDDLQKRMTEITRNTEQLLSSLELPALNLIDKTRLQQQFQRCQTLCQKLQSDLKNLKDLSKKLQTAESQWEKRYTAIGTLEKELLEAKHQAASVETEKRTITRQLETASTDLAILSKDLVQKLAPFGNFATGEVQLPPILEDLELRIETWKSKKAAASILEPKLTKIRTSISNTKTLCEKEGTLITELGKKRSNSQKDINDLGQQRSSLFGTKDTTKVEQILEQAVKDAQKALELSQLHVSNRESELSSNKTLHKRLHTEMTSRTEEISTQHTLFDTALNQSPFSSSQQLIAALLPPHDLKKLQELNDSLQKRDTELSALIKAKSLSLEHEKEKKLCQESESAMNEQLTDQEKQLQALQETVIKSTEQITRNSTDKSKSAKQLEAITTQREKLGSWNRLHMLIGSADGKKFRNFAQGLTFEMMVHHANSHLQRMSDRYILVRDTSQPLDLNVIDTYQAGEIRSTKNLSGGESFLVSLALALGLSRMASHNVRVDSLFLDEGFGTLDENALESALETLAQLREENKLIGIISHVAALKERVPLQIEIIPGSNGNSSIRGPGVTQEQ